MTDKFKLNRFVASQEKIYETALNEIKRGNKTSHWMWYIFPQYKGLAFSLTSQKYAITCIEEASMYFKHPILGKRLIEITTAFFILEGKTAYEVLGEPDYLKMKSCMTLFDLVQNDIDIFSNVLEKYYGGSQCIKTRSQILLNQLNNTNEIQHS
jgi:uncharacterized protein (DUF1810 family)